MTIERIVRPFLPAAPFDARTLAPDQPAVGDAPDTAHLDWSGNADASWSEEPSPVLMGVQVTWEEDRSRRKTETVRITNKDDPSQFVDVERIKQMVIKNSVTSEEIPIKMDWGT